MPQNRNKETDAFGNPIFQGLPGFRTRENRSGLDPLDTRTEAAHMQGVFFRNLFTLRLRTRNLFYLILMFLFGAVPFLFLAIMIFGTIFTEGSGRNLTFLLIPILFLMITGLLTLNFLLSILQIAGLIRSPHLLKAVQPGARDREKKLTKRRKDYR